MTRAELIEEMLEFGLDVNAAELAAGPLLPLFNDVRGFARAFIEDCPALVERAGRIHRQ